MGEAPNIIISKHKSGKEQKDLEQPLDYKTGWSNERFDRSYPDVKNPWRGSERDIKNRKGLRGESFGDECQDCGKMSTDIFRSVINGELEYQLCRECYGERNKIRK